MALTDISGDPSSASASPDREAEVAPRFSPPEKESLACRLSALPILQYYPCSGTSPVQVYLTKTASLCRWKKTPGQLFRLPHQATRRPPGAPSDLLLSQVNPFLYVGSISSTGIRGARHSTGEMGGGWVSRPPDYKSRMVKLHGPEGASGAQRCASQGLRPPPQSQSAPYLVLCYQRSAGFQMRSAGRQKSLCAGSLGNIRGLQPSPSAGPEFRPTLHPVSALSARARYALIIDRGPELSRRGPGNQDALREAPSEGRERSARSGPQPQRAPGADHQEKKGGGGSRGPTRPPIRLPRSPLYSRPLTPRSGGAATAPTLPAHTAGAGARGEQPAPGLLAFLHLPGPGRSQTRLKQRRQSPRGEAPGVRSLSATLRMDYIG
ncbi:hypothetical protein NDU88_005302 [Pleurodeles waltl]|uniref:Uncharacterized protein n=1 Tax=Pleurodeles waltl TaxID=8319 RepID=A0AAV7UIU2_PLEWA|nr:hypothetical protein NDU88_005302 [Pleurodeles waltl]